MRARRIEEAKASHELRCPLIYFVKIVDKERPLAEDIRRSKSCKKSKSIFMIAREYNRRTVLNADKSASDDEVTMQCWKT